MSRQTVCDSCGGKIPEPDSRPRDVPPAITVRGGLGAADFCAPECLLAWASKRAEESR